MLYVGIDQWDGSTRLPGLRGMMEAGPKHQGRGLGGAYISRRRQEGGAWGSVAAGRAGRRPRGPSRGSERAEAPRIRFTRWGNLWAEAV